MNLSAKPPEPGRKRKTFALFTAMIAGLLIDQQNHDWAKLLLIAIGSAGFLYGGFIEWKQYKAIKEWRKTQPVDTTLVGAPQYPHITHTVSFAVGLVSFFTLCYLWVPHMETGLTGNEWWMLALGPVAVLGFVYARRTQKRYDKAFDGWRQAQGRKSE